MLASALWMLILCQDPTAQKLHDWMLSHPEKVTAMPNPTDRSGQQERRELSHRYVKLVEALNHFADKYNSNRGNVWPMKEAEAVQRAYHDFERTMPTPKN